VSKLRRFLRTERTLREFISPPFTPREVDDGSGSFTRDVFALASVFVWAASPTDLLTYEDVGRYAVATDLLDEGVRGAVLQALSDDPDERPATAEQFLQRLDGLRRVRSTASAALSCQIELSEVKADSIGRTFGLSDRRAVEEAILDDLNAVCGVKSMLGANGEVAADPLVNLQLLGLGYSYHAKVDARTQDRLIILGARSIPSGLLERQRESALFPVLFLFETAFRSYSVARLESIYQTDEWWRPIHSALSVGADVRQIKRLNGVHVSRATVRTVEHILTDPEVGD
jgi:hypothetical protein